MSEDPLPHNSWTAGEIGWVRSPPWNSERKIGSGCTDAVCDVAAQEIPRLIVGHFLDEFKG